MKFLKASILPIPNASNCVNNIDFVLILIKSDPNAIAVPSGNIDTSRISFSLYLTTNSMTGFDCDFTNFPDFVNLTMRGNITNITDFGFINQLQGKIKVLDLTGLNNATRMTQLINAIYTMSTTKASITGSNSLPYRGIRLSLESYAGWTAAVIPTGVFQAPLGYVQGSSNGTPTTDREKLYVLQNQYGYTITYRAS